MNPQDLTQLLQMYLQQAGGGQGAPFGASQQPLPAAGAQQVPTQDSQAAGISNPGDLWPQQLPQNAPPPPPQPNPLAGISAQLPAAHQNFIQRLLQGLAQGATGRMGGAGGGPRGGGGGWGTQNNAAPQGVQSPGGTAAPAGLGQMSPQQLQQLQQLIQRLLSQGRVQ